MSFRVHISLIRGYFGLVWSDQSSPPSGSSTWSATASYNFFSAVSFLFFFLQEIGSSVTIDVLKFSIIDALNSITKNSAQ